jgi:hypothetical protein
LVGSVAVEGISTGLIRKRKFVNLNINGNDYVFDSYAGSVCTGKEMVHLTSKQDYRKGYRDRCIGHYDQWYSIYRADKGKSYRKGYEKAKKDGFGTGKIVVIESF